jgi:Major Facilitator Superfamily
MMGWTSPLVIGLISGGLAVLGVFCVIETRVTEPMFRLSLFRIRPFTAGNLASLLAGLGRGGLMFTLIIWLQGIYLPMHGYGFSQTPLWAGIAMLPLTVGFLTAGPVSGWLSDRYGARPFATGGMVLAAASFALLELLPVDFAYWQFAGILLLNGIGMGLFASPNRAGVMNSLPPDQRGVGAGMSTTFQNSAMVLSIGIFFTLIILGLAASLPARRRRGPAGGAAAGVDHVRGPPRLQPGGHAARARRHQAACEPCRLPHRPHLLPVADRGAVLPWAGHRLRLRHRGMPDRGRGLAAARPQVRARGTRPAREPC